MAFTFFFRDIHTLERTLDFFLPYVSGKSKINIWDAGCANGSEPYTLALLLAEKMNKFSFNNVKIYCTDIDISNQFGNIIKNGIYQWEEIARIPEDILLKYFRQIDEKKYQIVDEIRNKLVFYQHDLLSLQPIEKNFSLIICKNVLLHFSYEERIKVIQMFHSALLDNGLLVTEQTQKLPVELSTKFELLTSDAQILKKLT